MKVLIVEDETAAYENLTDILAEVAPDIRVMANTESVTQTVGWLQSNPAPDLIFMDIHLSDGSAFAIFDRIKLETPIIFTTAYDRYAIEAFKVNSIDYLLKPVKVEDVEHALEKYSKLTRQDLLQYLAQLTQLKPAPKYKDKLLPVSIKEISYFYATGKNTYVCLKDGNCYPYSKTLEQIVSSLNPTDFIRANKQFVIARDSVTDITIWFDSRLLITLDTEVPERVYVSKNKASEFKTWLVNDK